MSETNPEVTANDLITEVEARMGTPAIAQASYLPWISYAYQKTYNKYQGIGQHVRETFFGTLATVTLQAGVNEYLLSDTIPLYGGFIKGQIKYGGTSDDWVRLKVLRSLSKWEDQTNVTTSDWPKASALIYFLKDYFGIIPTPPTDDAGTPSAKIWYVKRPARITAAADVLDLPYRFLYPVVSYVHGMAVMAENEDYTNSLRIEARFDKDLEEAAIAIDSEFSEYEQGNRVEETDESLYTDPFRW